MNYCYPVTVCGKTFSDFEQVTGNPAWQQMLKRAKEKGERAKCECVPLANNLLVVRRYENRGEWFGIAKPALTGGGHDPRCRFHTSGSGLQNYSEKAVKLLPDGTYHINLKFPRPLLERQDDAHCLQERVGAGGTTRKNSMTLLGLAHLLFENGEINVWRSAWQSSRSWSRVARILYTESQRIRCGTRNLAEILLLGVRVGPGTPLEKGHKDDERLRNALNERLQIHQSNQRNRIAAERSALPLIAIGWLASYERLTKLESGAYPERLKFAECDGMPSMITSTEQWEKVRNRFPNAWNGWVRAGRVCVLAVLRPYRIQGERAQWQVVDLALQLMGKGFIPVESGYEAQVVERLIDEGRDFDKPLRFDADEDENLPDFVLRDTGSAGYVLEVFGRTDANYERREARKKSAYQTKYGEDWWWWKPNLGPMPPFPPKRERRYGRSFPQTGYGARTA